MSDVHEIIQSTKKLESILERQFGATGRGLHGKVSSVSNLLPEAVVRELRWIATLRNKALHEDNYDFGLDRNSFFAGVARCVSLLGAPTRAPARWPEPAPVVAPNPAPAQTHSAHHYRYHQVQPQTVADTRNKQFTGEGPSVYDAQDWSGAAALFIGLGVFAYMTIVGTGFWWALLAGIVSAVILGFAIFYLLSRLFTPLLVALFGSLATGVLYVVYLIIRWLASVFG